MNKTESELMEDLLDCVGTLIRSGKYDIWSDTFSVPSDAFTGTLASFAAFRAIQVGVEPE